jgi:hypothetical protein
MRNFVICVQGHHIFYILYVLTRELFILNFVLLRFMLYVLCSVMLQCYVLFSLMLYVMFCYHLYRLMSSVTGHSHVIRNSCSWLVSSVSSQ